MLNVCLNIFCGELRLAYSKIEVLLSKLSISNSKVDMLSYSIWGESFKKELVFAKIKELKKFFFDVKQDQEICSQRLSEAVQKTNFLNP